MSAGSFTISKYETNNGDIVSCRVQPETLAMTIGGTANAAVAGSVQAGWPSALMRGGRTEIGIVARKVRIGIPDGGTAPDGYSGAPVYVPILSEALWAAATKGDVVTYLGETWELLTKVPEYIN
jgi:hypothetical protein